MKNFVCGRLGFKMTEVFFATIFLVLCGPGLVYAQYGFQIQPKEKIISVMSTGEASARPSQALISFKVEGAGPSAKEAIRIVNNKAGDVVSALKEIGIEQKALKKGVPDLKSAAFDISRMIQKPPAEPPSDSGNVIATVYLTVAVENPPDKKVDEVMKEIAKIIDAATNAGAVSSAGGGSGFTAAMQMAFQGGRSNIQWLAPAPDMLKYEATLDAIEKAKVKAKRIAEAMGVKITSLHSVQAVDPKELMMSMMPQFYSNMFKGIGETPSAEAVKAQAVITVNYTFE